MSVKQRLSATIDADLLAAAERAAASGEVDTVSAWVNDAMRLKLAHDQRLRALAAYIEAFEAEHGEISQQDMDAAVREAKRRAVSPRGTRAGESRKKYGK
jgi:hypothetical protein